MDKQDMLQNCNGNNNKQNEKKRHFTEEIFHMTIEVTNY